MRGFRPDRKETRASPEVHAANAFIGNMLRFEILSRYGKCQQILDESVSYLLYMAERDRDPVGERRFLRELQPRLRVAHRPHALSRRPRPVPIDPVRKRSSSLLRPRARLVRGQGPHRRGADLPALEQTGRGARVSPRHARGVPRRGGESESIEAGEKAVEVLSRSNTRNFPPLFTFFDRRSK